MAEIYTSRRRPTSAGGFLLMCEQVTRSDPAWAVAPIRQPRVLTTVPDRIWSEEEWSRIQLGYRAVSMDERWHLFVEDDRLFSHRNWLGDGRHEAAFETLTAGVALARSRSSRVHGAIRRIRRCQASPVGVVDLLDSAGCTNGRAA